MIKHELDWTVRFPPEDRAERLVSRDDVRDGPLEVCTVELAADSHCECAVVRRDFRRKLDVRARAP